MILIIHSRWATKGLVKISQRGCTGGESDSTTYMLKPLLNLVFPHGNGENTWLLVKVAQPSSLGSVRDGLNDAKKPLGTQNKSTFTIISVKILLQIWLKIFFHCGFSVSSSEVTFLPANKHFYKDFPLQKSQFCLFCTQNKNTFTIISSCGTTYT